jgi:tRNA threonylcarbamoyladenosine biosynthesis protein TsaE
MVTKTNSAKETQKLATKFAEEIRNGGTVCLIGDLGAGKTTFSQAVARALGVKERVVSPTFILVRRYEIPGNRFFWHIDLYRLNSHEEIRGLGIQEIVSDPENVVLIEWPEKIMDWLPQKRWEVQLESTAKNARTVTIDKLS